MTAVFDTIVIGLGGMGSAAAYHLASRGRRVLGLERFGPGHSQGSSHGGSRIIRQAYFEAPAYVPLVLHAYELWQRLERETGRSLLRITGGLMLGNTDSEVVSGSLRSAREYGLPHETLDAVDIRRRFPQFNVAPETAGLYETMAGIVYPEASVRAHLDRAAALGATLRFEEPVTAWDATASGDGVRVMTVSGSYQAANLVITPGGWAPDLLSELDLPLEVERQVQYWFAPRGGIEPFLPDRFPIFIWEGADGLASYGFPAIDGPGGGVKVALHHNGVRCTADTIDRTVHDDEVAAMCRYLAERIPALSGSLLKSATCIYTNTPDLHFVIGAHPRHPQVSIAAGFSGHGYKFAGVVGEILADLATSGATRHPVALFAPGRLLERKD